MSRTGAYLISAICFWLLSIGKAYDLFSGDKYSPLRYDSVMILIIYAVSISVCCAADLLYLSLIPVLRPFRRSMLITA